MTVLVMQSLVNIDSFRQINFDFMRIKCGQKQNKLWGIPRTRNRIIIIMNVLLRIECTPKINQIIMLKNWIIFSSHFFMFEHQKCLISYFSIVIKHLKLLPFLSLINQKQIILQSKSTFVIFSHMKEEQSIIHKPLYSKNIYGGIKIAVCTWNLHGALPPTDSLNKLINKLVQDPNSDGEPNILIIATQECENSLPVSMICQGKSQWENMLRQCTTNYKLVETNQLVGVHSGILVKKEEIKSYITRRKSVLRAGKCNMLGNKGAVNIVFNFQGQDIQVINCHLAPHETGTQRRNQILLFIANNVVEVDPSKQVIICGDLNYRIQMNKEEYTRKVADVDNTEKHMNYFQRLKDEQLRNQTVLKQKFLPFYQEGEITFPPTYKLGANHQMYFKNRIPGWTDRIFSRKGRIKQVEYSCMYDLFGSDHRPVIGVYQIEPVEGLTILDEDLLLKKEDSSCQLI